MKICTFCQSVLVDDYDGEFCPLRECQGHVANIDENIAPAIIELNRKGYATEFSCSGHFNRSYLDNYISFSVGVQLDNAPEGFELEKRQDEDGKIHHVVRLNISDEEWEKVSTEDRILAITRNNLAVLRWARGLPQLDPIV
jgi:hypothetical protein